MMNKLKLANDAPFYSWNCITLSIKNKWDLNLIIKDEQVMTDFLKLLIYKTESMDGTKGTMIPFKKKLMRKHKRNMVLSEWKENKDKIE